MSAWFDCAYRAEWIYLLGQRNPIGLKAVMGSALHASTALYDQSMIDGSGLTVDEAVGALVDVLDNPGEDYRPVDTDPPRADGERICRTLHSVYCNEWSPKFSWESVELTVEPMDIRCSNTIVRLTGTLDRCRVFKSAGKEPGRGIVDLKSGTRSIIKGQADTKKHLAQIGVYELLAENTTGNRVKAPAGVIALQTTKTPKIAATQIPSGLARTALIGTDEQPGLIEIAAAMFERGLFPPNPSSNLCHPNYCPRWNHCIYHT